MKEAIKRWLDGVRARFCPTPSRKRLLRLVKDIKKQLAFERDGREYRMRPTNGAADHFWAREWHAKARAIAELIEEMEAGQ